MRPPPSAVENFSRRLIILFDFGRSTSLVKGFEIKPGPNEVEMCPTHRLIDFTKFNHPNISIITYLSGTSFE